MPPHLSPPPALCSTQNSQSAQHLHNRSDAMSLPDSPRLEFPVNEMTSGSGISFVQFLSAHWLRPSMYYVKIFCVPSMHVLVMRKTLNFIRSWIRPLYFRQFISGYLTQGFSKFPPEPIRIFPPDGDQAFNMKFTGPHKTRAQLRCHHSDLQESGR